MTTIKQFRSHDGWVYLNDLQIPLDLWKQLQPEYKLPPQDRRYDNGLPWITWEYIPSEKVHRVATKNSEKHLPMPNEQLDAYIKDYGQYKSALDAKEKELKLIQSDSESETINSKKKVKK